MKYRSALGASGGADPVDVSSQNVNQLRGLNQNYGNLKMAEEPALNREMSKQANLGIGLRELGAGTIGGLTGGPWGAVAGAVGSKFLKESGEQTGAAVLNGTSNILQKAADSKFAPVLKAAAQRGPQSLAVAHYLLSQKDPAYQALQNDKKDK